MVSAALVIVPDLWETELSSEEPCRGGWRDDIGLHHEQGGRSAYPEEELAKG